MLISGCCAAGIWLASVTSSGSVERSGTSAANSMACLWCAIMLSAKVMSAGLKPAGLPVITGVSLNTESECPSPAESAGPVHAAGTTARTTAAKAAATRAGLDLMQPDY